MVMRVTAMTFATSTATMNQMMLTMMWTIMMMLMMMVLAVAIMMLMMKTVTRFQITTTIVCILTYIGNYDNDDNENAGSNMFFPCNGSLDISTLLQVVGNLKRVATSMTMMARTDVMREDACNAWGYVIIDEKIQMYMMLANDNDCSNSAPHV